jgi:hypothetical protein
MLSKKTRLILAIQTACCTMFLASNSHADEYVISSDSTTQNDGNALADGDSITLSEGVTITASDAIDDAGASNLIVNIYGAVIGNDPIELDTDSNVLNVFSTGSALNTVDDGIGIGGNNNTAKIYSGATITGNDEGLGITGDGNTFFIHGIVQTTGTVDDDGIDIEGSGNTVYLSGTVKLPGTCSAGLGECNAIEFDEGNTLQLNEGAIIIGGIQSSDGVSFVNSLDINVGAAQSYVYTLNSKGTIGVDSLAWQVDDLDARSFVSTSTLAAAAGIGNVETADELMFDRAFSLDGSLARLGLQETTGERQALFDAYGFSQSRDGNGITAAYELDSRGMTLGMPLDLLGHDAIAFVNYHDSEITIASGTHDIFAQSLRFGLSVPQMWSGEDYDIGLYAVAGRNSYDGTRDVLLNQNTTTGIATVDSSWDGTELELGVDASIGYDVSERLSIGGSLGLAAQVERVGSYSEQNYFAWDRRTIVQAHAKAELTLGYQASTSTRLYGTAGAWRRDVRSGETANYSINDTAVSYHGGVYDDTITSLRLGARHSLANGAVVSAEAVALDSSSADSRWGVSIGIAARF